MQMKSIFSFWSRMIEIVFEKQNRKVGEKNVY